MAMAPADPAVSSDAPTGHSSHRHQRSSSSNSSNTKKGLLSTKSTHKRPSYHSRASSGSTGLGLSKLGKGASKKRAEVVEVEDRGMATSFLQYCATCERQITVPDNYILYCSESCRRKDSAKPLSISISTTHTMSHSTTSSPPTSPEPPSRTIVPPMAPTKVTATVTPSIRIPGDLHHSTSDLDPTEWKPKEGRTSNGSIFARDGAPMYHSAAWQYLSQFHRSVASGVSHGKSDETLSLTSHEGNQSGTGTPTLAHSPSSTASSFNSTTGDNYAGYMNPLPPRRNPAYSASTRDLDLIIPCAPNDEKRTAAAALGTVRSRSPPVILDQEQIWGREIAKHLQYVKDAADAAGKADVGDMARKMFREVEG